MWFLYHQPPRITVNRIKASLSRERASEDPDGLRTVFGQIFTQLRSVRFEIFRRAVRDQQVWSVNFMGEGMLFIGSASMSILCTSRTFPG